MTRPKMTGGQLQDAVAQLAQAFGGLVFHARPARTNDGWRTPVAYDGKGYPDLTIGMPGGVVFAEIKGDGDRLRPDQRVWLSVLARVDDAAAWVGDDGRIENPTAVARSHTLVALWTPAHWREGHIERTLRRLR